MCWLRVGQCSSRGGYGRQASKLDATKKGQSMQRRNVRTLIVSSGLMLLALLAACKTIPTTGTTPDVCLIWKPVTYSAGQDSGETINEVREQNAKRNAYCQESRR